MHHLSNLAATVTTSCFQFLLLGIVFPATMLAAQATSQATPPQPALEALANIRFQNDIRVFTVTAALNVAGFDRETPGHDMSPFRQAIRLDLKHLDPQLVQRLRVFYEQHRGEETSGSQAQTAYISLALLVSPPPSFSLDLQESELPRDVWRVRGFEKLLSEFYRKGAIAELWQRYRLLYDQELGSYREVFRQIIQSTLKYFRVPARIVLDRQIVLIPDLLDVKEIVNARNLERVYYLLVGPSDDPFNNRLQLEHEYLHFLLDPLVDKFGISLLKAEGLLDLAQQQPRIKDEYQNKLLLIVTESLIESLQLRMHPPATTEDLNRKMVELFRQGLVFAPYFHRQLEIYEGTEGVAFPSYAESLLKGVKQSGVEEDARAVQALEEGIREAEERQLAAEKQQKAEAQERQRTQVLFGEASQLLSEGQFEQARLRLEELLRIDPDNGDAFFYLAQIFSQKKDPDRAFGYYQRSADSSQTRPWVRAWSRLRLGKILASRGEFEAARALFSQVGGLEGELKGAQEEARRSLDLLPKPR
ncbi:MAG: tetratricopeptide repeat protein [Acidobacteriota bacterium]